MEHKYVEPVPGIILTLAEAVGGSSYAILTVHSHGPEGLWVTHNLLRKELAELGAACYTMAGWISWHGVKWALATEGKEFSETEHIVAVEWETKDRTLCMRKTQSDWKIEPVHELLVHPPVCLACLTIYRQRKRIEELESLIARQSRSRMEI